MSSGPKSSGQKAKKTGETRGVSCENERAYVRGTFQLKRVVKVFPRNLETSDSQKGQRKKTRRLDYATYFFFFFFFFAHKRYYTRIGQVPKLDSMSAGMCPARSIKSPFLIWCSISRIVTFLFDVFQDQAGQSVFHKSSLI